MYCRRIFLDEATSSLSPSPFPSIKTSSTCRRARAVGRQRLSVSIRAAFLLRAGGRRPGSARRRIFLIALGVFVVPPTGRDRRDGSLLIANEVSSRDERRVHAPACVRDHHDLVSRRARPGHKALRSTPPIARRHLARPRLRRNLTECSGLALGRAGAAPSPRDGCWRRYVFVPATPRRVARGADRTSSAPCCGPPDCSCCVHARGRRRKEGWAFAADAPLIRRRGEYPRRLVAQEATDSASD